MTTEFGAEHMDGHGENGESLRILTTDRADRDQAKVHYIGSCARNSWRIGLIFGSGWEMVLVGFSN